MHGGNQCWCKAGVALGIVATEAALTIVVHQTEGRRTVICYGHEDNNSHR
jgi:hypothetical protein